MKRKIIGFTISVILTVAIMLWSCAQPLVCGFPMAAFAVVLGMGVLGFFLSLYNFWNK